MQQFRLEIKLLIDGEVFSPSESQELGLRGIFAARLVKCALITLENGRLERGGSKLRRWWSTFPDALDFYCNDFEAMFFGRFGGAAGKRAERAIRIARDKKALPRAVTRTNNDRSVGRGSPGIHHRAALPTDHPGCLNSLCMYSIIFE